MKRLLGAEGVALSETLLEWSKLPLDPKLRKKLTESGILLESGRPSGVETDLEEGDELDELDQEDE